MKRKTVSGLSARGVKGDLSRAGEAGSAVRGSENSSDCWQAVVDSLEDELMVIDRDYRIIEANKAFLLRHGKHRQEVVGQHCYEISHGLPELCRPPHHECPIKEAWETGKLARATHAHIYDVNGNKQERYVDIIASPITDNQGNVTRVVELTRDVTETKELESRIAKAHQDLLALNVIASVVSQSLDLDTVLESALDKTLEIMQRRTGGILLLDEGSKMLRYRVHRGLANRYAKEMWIRLGEGIAGRVAQTGVAIMVDDISKDPRAIHPDLIAREGIRAFASVPLRSRERIVGVLNVASHEARKFSAEDTQLLESIAAQIAVAIENARLHEEVRHKEEVRGELLQEIFAIQEEERKRIARELHDETSQVLASLAASLRGMSSILLTDHDKAVAMLKKAETLSVNILDEIHKLIYELRPTLLDDLGLVAAVRWLADNKLQAAGIEVNFKTTGRIRRLPIQLETTLFRVIQEAVYNIIRHASARNVLINLCFRGKMVTVHIKDDGKGFDVEEAISSENRPRGLGLLGMMERVELVKGAINISSHPGGGTEIEIKILLNQEVPNENE